MAKRVLGREEFEQRRRKEELAFLVVKFLKAYAAFDDIRAEFMSASERGCLVGCGLFDRVRDLEESLAFDLKEKAHFLFRVQDRQSAAPRVRSRDTSKALATLKRGIETRTIDSYIGTGFHLLLMLRESLYQLEAYTPLLAQEQGELAKIEELARTASYTFTPAEQRELNHLRSLGEISERLGEESERMVTMMFTRCQESFSGTAEVILRLLESAADNEILVQNLLLNTALLDRVYGKGAAEQIFGDMFRGRSLIGASGMDKALAFARARCGNNTALPTSAR